ncbi:hypothetical protein P7K49_021656 [Saguinus oedipus]|uniref:Uncharacterized protein n=1 Tax=Saguinus oedipus TaxID=9490 RepID=A0ABQ9UT88_SAGOE|nr:hypothetical protein P7K49_021656 [Saguinus oedipus]
MLRPAALGPALGRSPTSKGYKSGRRGGAGRDFPGSRKSSFLVALAAREAGALGALLTPEREGAGGERLLAAGRSFWLGAQPYLGASSARGGEEKLGSNCGDSQATGFGSGRANLGNSHILSVQLPSSIDSVSPCV